MVAMVVVFTMAPPGSRCNSTRGGPLRRTAATMFWLSTSITVAARYELEGRLEVSTSVVTAPFELTRAAATAPWA